MKEEELKTIGVFAICNTGGICVHAIDYVENKVLASINGENPEWCDIIEKPLSSAADDGAGGETENDSENENDDLESGFLFGSFFVPFSEVMRV